MKRIVVFLLAIMTALLMVAGCGTENASQGKQSATRVVKDIDGTEDSKRYYKGCRFVAC